MDCLYSTRAVLHPAQRLRERKSQHQSSAVPKGVFWSLLEEVFLQKWGKKIKQKVKSLHVFKSKTLTNRLWSANVISIRIRDGMEICLKALIQIPRLIFSYHCCNSNSACGRFRNQKKGTRAVGLPLAKKRGGQWEWGKECEMELICNIPNPTAFPVYELFICQSPNANPSVCSVPLISVLPSTAVLPCGTHGLQVRLLPPLTARAGMALIRWHQGWFHGSRAPVTQRNQGWL